MVKIEDKMSELVGGAFKIKLEDDTEFELRPTMKHKRKLQFNYKESQEISQRYTKLEDRGKLDEKFVKEYQQKSKELLDNQNSILREIVQHSYPQFDEERMDVVIMNYEGELLLELFICFKWLDKNALEQFKKQKEEELKKLSGGGVNPT